MPLSFEEFKKEREKERKQQGIPNSTPASTPKSSSPATSGPMTFEEFKRERSGAQSQENARAYEPKFSANMSPVSTGASVATAEDNRSRNNNDPKWQIKEQYDAAVEDEKEARNNFLAQLTNFGPISGTYSDNLKAAYNDWQNQRHEANDLEEDYKKAFEDYREAQKDYNIEKVKAVAGSALLGHIPQTIAFAKHLSDEYDYLNGKSDTAPKSIFEDYLITPEGREAAKRYAAQGGDPSSSVLGSGYLEMIAPVSDALGYVGQVAGIKDAEKLREFADKAQNLEAQWVTDQKTSRGKAGQFGVDVGVQAVPLLADAALTYASGGGSAAAKAALATRAFGGGTMEARKGGGSLAQQGLYGAGSAAVELLTEKMFDAFGSKVYGASAMDDVINHWAGKTFKSPAARAAAKYVAEAAGEGIEEVTSDVINPILKSIYNDKSIVENYKDMFADFDSVVYDFAIGAALGAVGGSTNVVSQMAGNVSAQEAFFMDAGREGKTFSQAAAEWKALEASGEVNAENVVSSGKDSSQAAGEQKAPNRQTTPPAPQSDVKLGTVELNSVQQREYILRVEQSAKQQQELADKTSYAPQKAVYQEEADRLRKKAQELRAKYGIEEAAAPAEETSPDNDAEPREALEEVSRQQPEPKPVEDTIDAGKEGEEFSPEETESPDEQPEVSEPVKAETEPAKTGADVLVEQAQSKPKTKRKPKSKDVVSIGDSVTAHEKGGKKSAKTVFDSTKVKGSKWAFNGKSRGDEVTVNGKTYIIDRIDSGSAADILAEAYEESTHKQVKATKYREDQKAKTEKRNADAEAKAERESKKDVEEKTRDRAAKILGKTFGKKYETLLRTFGTKQQNQFAGRDTRAPKDVRISLKGDVLEHNTKRGDNATASVTNSAFKAKLKEVFGGKPVVITGQTVNTFAESKYKRSEFRDEQGWLAVRGEAGKPTGREFVVNSLSVDGKALTGAEYYKSLEKLGLKAKSRIDVSQPRFRSANPEVYEERRGYITDRNIDINERLRYAQEMDELDFIEDVNNYIEAYFREERENGEFTGNPDAFEKQLKEHIEKYKDDHDFSWVVDGEELVRRDNKRNYTYALEGDTYLDELTKEYEDVTGFNEALDSHIMRRPSYALTKEYMAKEIKAVLEDESKLETYGEEDEKLRSGTFTLMLHKVNSPYGVTITHGMGKNPTYTVEVFHNKAKVDDGTRVRLLRQSGKSTSSLAEDVAEAIYKYEHGEAYAQESVMDMTRKQMAEELTKQVPDGELSKKRNNRDYSGEYSVGEFSAKVEKDYTDYWGEKVFSGFHADFYRNGAKVGEADYKPYKGKNPDVVQKLATDFHNLNYREGEQHMFDLLKSESKEFATLQGYSQDQRELDKSRARLYNDLDLRTFDSQFEPKVVGYDGKLYEVINAYDGNTPQYIVYEVDEKQNRVNNLEAEINLKNASTPEKAAEYAVKHKKFVDNTSDESMKSAQKYLAQKKAKKTAERKAQNESKAEEKQSESATGTGGAEAEAGGRPDGQVERAEASRADDRESDGRPRLRRLLDLRSKGRVAQGYEESRAKDVADNITFGRSKVRFVDVGDELVRELGLTVPVQETVGKGENERKRLSGEILIPANLPDGDIARRGVAGHEGTHAEFVNKYGADAGKMQVAAWRAFQSSHPAEAQIMERFVLTKKSYFGEHAGKSFDDMPGKLQETAAKELFAHWAGGTVRTRTAEGAERATKYQLMLQDFLIKEQGFRPNAFKRTTFKVKGVDHSNGPITVSEWFTIRDEIAKYSQAISAALGGDVSQDEVVDALDASDVDERPESPKYSDVEETLNQASKEGEEPLKREASEGKAKSTFGKDYDKVQKSADDFDGIKTRFDDDAFQKSNKGRDRSTRGKLKKLREAFRKAATTGDVETLFSIYEDLKNDSNLANFYNEEIQEDIDNWRKLSDPNLDSYNEGAAPYAAARTMQRMAHKFKLANEYQQTLSKMNETLRGSKNGILRKIGKSERLTAAVARALMRWQVNPDTVFKMIDAFDKGNAGEGYKLAKELQTAHREKYRVLREARATFDKASALKGFQDFAFGKQTVKDYSGREWDMRSALSVVKAIDTIRSTSGKKLGGTDGFGVMDNKGNIEFISMKDVDAVKLYESLKSGLSDVAIKYGDLATEAFNAVKEPLRAKYKQNNGVDIGMIGDEDARLGDKKGIEKAVYSPLSYVDKSGNVYQFDIAKQETYNNIPRFLRERSDAGGTYILIKPYTEVTGKYFEQVSNYLAYSTFNEKMKGLGKSSSYESGLGNTLAEVFGKDMGNWYKSYVEDLATYQNEDDVEGVNSLLRKGRQQLQQGALLFSVSVPMKQISSYWAASGILHPDSLIKNYRIKLLRPKNSSDAATMLASRAMGNLEQSAAEAAKDAEKWLGKLKYSSKFVKLAADAINQMDYNTVSNLLSATEYDVLKYQFNGDKSVIGTDEYKTAVEEKFQDVVDRSQPNFDKQMRAEYGRTDNEIVRMLSMFRTQQTQNLNLLATAIGEFMASKGTKNEAQAMETLKQTIAGQAASALSLSMLTILADMLLHRQKKYEDKDKELDITKVLQRLGINAIEASAGTMWFGDSIAKWAIDRISGGKTKEFYGVNMGVISTVSDILENFENFVKNPSRSNARYCAGNIATLMGVPLNNAYSMLNSAIMYGKDLLGSNEGDYDDILKYLDAQAKAKQKEEEKAAKEAAKNSGADLLADTAKQNSSQSKLNSQEATEKAPVSGYLTKPYNALVEAGMSSQRSQEVLTQIDTDGNNSVKQAEMIAYWKAHPEDEQYVMAMWNSYGYKTTWEAAKKKAG